MIDLPDYGYSSYTLRPVDPGGVVGGSMGGPDDIITRPGYRYSITYALPFLRVSDAARIFQTRLEQASRDDVSYPWPLDYKPQPAGAPLVSATSPAGAVIPIKGLLPGYSFKEGQPLAVISGGVGYIHRVTTPVVASGTGTVTVNVFPLTRATFLNNDVIEIENPRIRGVASWDNAQQGVIGRRPFTFTITERR